MDPRRGVGEGVILRRRSDDWRDAGRWRAILLGAVPDPRLDRMVRWDPDFLAWIDTHDAALVGDVWEVRRGQVNGHLAHSHNGDRDWAVGGYALVCPVESCTYGVHSWTHAFDCPARETFGGRCKRGEGRQSCWDWTGSVEDHDLTADPSLQVLKACLFHGHLRQGVLA